MASTRNKNTFGNYGLQQRSNIYSEDWLLYKYGANGIAYDTRLPGNGLNPGQMPWNTLSHNAVDIETFLFGINSTNLVKPAPPLTPELKCLKNANLYKKDAIIMPTPQAIPKHQRPMYLA
jgi:hypothetical protein